jgi:hypothetical protein
MRQVAQYETERFWKEVREEFPDDPMMQDVHYARLLLQAQLRDLPGDERLRFLNETLGQADPPDAPPEVPETGASGTVDGGSILAQRSSGPGWSPKRDESGVITNADQLSADVVAHERVLCPGCRRKVFAMWPEGWDAHAAFKCGGVCGTQEGRKAEFRRRFAHLFRSR